MFHTIQHPSLYVKWREEGGTNGRTFGLMTYVFPSHHYAWWTPAFLEMAEHLPGPGKGWTNSLVWLVFMCGFSFTYWTLFISTHKFYHFYSSNTFLHPTGEKWVSNCVGRSWHPEVKSRHYALELLECCGVPTSCKRDPSQHGHKRACSTWIGEPQISLMRVWLWQMCPMNPKLVLLLASKVVNS